MLDLSFGLPIVVRDAALKMVAPGPESSLNREYYAQEHEREIEEGRGGVEEYEKTDEKARELLRRLANSEPYYKRQRRIGNGEDGERSGEKTPASGLGESRNPHGPIRTRDSRGRGTPGPRGSMQGARGGGRGGRVFPSTAQLPPGPRDILPPADINITSLFVTGVEDDLPEHALRTFFTPFGTIRSIICSHRSHCAFINYATREGAETAAENCQGKAVIAGCPLRIQWGRPRPLDNMERDQRIDHAREGRNTAAAVASANTVPLAQGGRDVQGSQSHDDYDVNDVVAPPPGADDVRYASLAGN